MSKTKLFRAIALINFVILLSAFLLYRNGTFDSLFDSKEDTNLTSQNNAIATEEANDSLPANRDSLKSATTMFAPKATIFIDTAEAKNALVKAAFDSVRMQQRRTILSSSKSMTIVEPRFLDTPKKLWIPNPNTNPK